MGYTERTNEVGFWEAFFASDAIMVIAIGLVLGLGERLFDLFIELRDWFNPIFVVDEFQMGVVLRFGRYQRTVSPGFHWKWPCGIEEQMLDTVVRTTAYLEVQSLTTKDGYHINSSPVIVYRIGNIKRWLLEVDQAEEALKDVTYGLNEELTLQTNLEDILKPEFAQTLTTAVKEAGTGWGARVEAVKFSDKARSKSLRLWQ